MAFPFLNTVAMLLLSIFVCSYVSLPASCPGYIPKAKGRRDIQSTLAFLVSRRACRPTAVFYMQLAGS